MAVDWLNAFEGNPMDLIERIKGEESERFKLMSIFLIENRVLPIRTVLPPLIAAAFAINDGKFINSLLNEANMIDISNTVQLLRQKAAGIGLNKRIRFTLQNWMYTLSGDKLQLEGLTYSEACKEVINLIHTNPKKFQINWWQSYIFGEKPPGDSLIAKYKKIASLTPEARYEIIENHAVSWTYLLSKAFKNELPIDIVEVTIDKAPFMYLVHYLDKLVSVNKNLDKKLAKKLIQKSNETNFNYGLVLKKYLYDSKGLDTMIKAALLESAQILLKNARTPELKEPVFIIGDNSGSMQASIEAAVLMSCILSQKLQGSRLLFFNNEVKTYKPPKDINGIIKALKDIRANGSTAVAAGVGAAALQGAKTIILISDGGHNQPSRSYKSDLQSLKVDPKLKGIDFFYIMVKGDDDVVWDTYKNRDDEITRIINLKKTNVTFIFGFLKILLQFFNYDPRSTVWNQVEALKGAFLPDSPMPSHIQEGSQVISVDNTNDNNKQSEKCVICRKTVTKKNAMLLICGHRYHKQCLQRYWELLDGEYRCVFNCQTPLQKCMNCGELLKEITCEFCGTEYLKL